MKKWALLVVAFQLSGCVGTKIVSQVNHETTGYRFSKVMAFGNFENLEYRRLAESKLCEAITRVSASECVRWSQTFFPKQEYTAFEMAAKLGDLGVDGVLTLQAKDSGFSSAYVPESTQTTGSATVFGNTVYGSSRTQTYGGYSISKPWSEYEILLWSPGDGKVAWYASASSRGNAFSGWNDLIVSAAKKSAAQLVRDGVLK